MKLFLSGAESKNSYGCIIGTKQKYILMSYLYLRKKKTGIQEYIDRLDYPAKFMIDSGAHSFMGLGVAHALKSTNPEKGMYNYLADYVAFIEENQKHIDVAVEMDIQTAAWNKNDDDTEKGWIGLPMIAKWREEIFKPLNERLKATSICIVNHGEPLKETAQYTNFIGVSTHRQFKGTYGAIFSFAKKNNTKIHGFAVTDNSIKKYNFYSVDSTSWLSGNRFGITYSLQGSTMRNITQKARRKRFKSFCKKYDIDFEGLIKDENKAVMDFNCMQWKLYADYVEKRWTSNKGEKVAKQEVVTEGEASDKKVAVKTKGKKNLPAKVRTVEDIEEARVITTNAFLECNECYIGEKCPKFLEDERCAYKLGTRFENPDDMKTMLQKIINLQYGRVMRGKLIEESDGGVPDKVLSQEINLLMSLVKDIKALTDNRDELVIKAKGAPGTGIFAQIFGDLNKGKKD